MLKFLLVAIALFVHTEFLIIWFAFLLAFRACVIWTYLTSVIQKLNTALTVVWSLAFADLQILRNFIKSLELSDFIRCVFKNDVTFFVLELTKTAHQQITNTNPYFLSHFTSDMSYSFNLIKALNKDSTITQHFECQSILKSIITLLSKEISFNRTWMLSFLIVLTTSTFILRHTTK